MTARQNKLTSAARKAEKNASDRPAAHDPEAVGPEAVGPESVAPALADDVAAVAGTEKSGMPFRVHDYRPDGRGSALASLSGESGDEPWTPPTETHAPAGATMTTATMTTATTTAQERFMTRRELRLRERAEAAREPSPDSAAPAQDAEMEPVADEAGVVEELAVVDAEVVEAELVEAELVPEAEPQLEPGWESDYRAPAVSRGIEPAPDGTGVPFEHWSHEGGFDGPDPVLGDDAGVSTGAITTHALVLPSLPASGDQMLNSLAVTGDVLVTGSIDLPRTFGSTGAHPALFDHPDVDALIDEDDPDDAVAESAPVRATRAVSSSSSNRSVIEPPPRRKLRLALVAGMAGGAVVLLGAGGVAAGLILNLF